MSAFLRQYGTGTGSDVIIPMPRAGLAEFSTSSNWTPVSGDVKVSKDGAAAANIGTLPAYITSIGWKFVFTDSELSAGRINVTIVDAAGGEVDDNAFVVETYGHPSAQHPDLGIQVGTTGVAQAGAASSITLASGESAVDDFFNDMAVAITGGTGVGQVRKITDYVGSTKVATVGTAWETNPDSTSVYMVLGRIE